MATDSHILPHAPGRKPRKNKVSPFAAKLAATFTQFLNEDITLVEFQEQLHGLKKAARSPGEKETLHLLSVTDPQNFNDLWKFYRSRLLKEGLRLESVVLDKAHNPLTPKIT